MKTDLSKIESELKKRHQYPYNWYRKQNDIWDGYTNFIYNTPQWEDLIDKIAATVKEHQLDKKELFYYAINRWYNFWSAMAVENIFSNCKKITPNLGQIALTLSFPFSSSNTIPIFSSEENFLLVCLLISLANYRLKT